MHELGSLLVLLTFMAGIFLLTELLRAVMNGSISISISVSRPNTRKRNNPKPVPVQNNPNRTVHYNVPRKPLTGIKLSNWDPGIWVGRDISVYKIEELVGEGGNGYVFKGTYSGRPLAIKILKLDKGKPEDFFKDLALEASNLISLSDHKNIVKIYAVNIDELVIENIINGDTELYLRNPPMIVMEYMGGGTLKELLNDDNFYYSSEWKRAVLKAICNVAGALDYIHSRGFVHMDVKPQNVFLNFKPDSPSELYNVVFKLGDLGSAVRANTNIRQVTPEYSPPEVFIEPVKPYSDIFSLGVMTYVLFTRKFDRPDINEMEDALDCYVKRDLNCVKNKVEKAKMKLMKWDINIGPEIDPLLRSMLSADPLKRPTARGVMDSVRKLDPTACT
jgi:serine/threonine protein kinase